jgi:hypothetical protein
MWKDLYALLDSNLLKVKLAMENHVRVEEANILRYEPHCIRRMRMRNLSNIIILLVEIIISRKVSRLHQLELLRM